MKIIFLLLVLSAGFLTTSQAQARKALVPFGPGENLRTIQKLDREGLEGEKYYLKHKTSSFALIFPLYIIDEGYVLTISSDPLGTYYPLTGDLIKTNQESGLLPDPLPNYSISLLDYAFGYSF